MAKTSGRRLVLALDWNGTVVDDVERAYVSLRAALGSVAVPPADLDAFRDGFRLPLSSWFAGLGVPSSLLTAVERRWNEEMCRRPAALSRGAEQLLLWCRAQVVPVRVVTGAEQRLVELDAARLGYASSCSTWFPDIRSPSVCSCGGSRGRRWCSSATPSTTFARPEERVRWRWGSLAATAARQRSGSVPRT